MPDIVETTYSAASTFRDCRQKYKHRYIDLIEKDRPPAAPLWIGTVVHDCLEMWHRGEPLGEIIDYLDDLRTEDNTKNWVQCVAIMQAYARTYPTEDSFEILELEEVFRGPLVNPETGRASTTMVLTGKVDGLIKLESGEHAILEHKTTTLNLERYVETLWTDFQTRFYCQQYGKYKGISIRKAMFNIIKKSLLRKRKGESEEALIERMTDDIQFKRYLLSFEPTLLDEIGTQVWELKDNMQLAARSGKYYKNESQCRHAFGGMCDYFDLCSSGMNPIVRNALYRKRKTAHTELSNSEETNVTQSNDPA